MNTHLLEQARLMTIEDQLELVQALWEGIAKRDAAPGATAAQINELGYRLAEHQACPEEVLSWQEVKALALARIAQ